MTTVSNLAPGQREILDKWATIAREDHRGSTFSMPAESKHAEIEERLPKFLDDPSEETFVTLWDTIYSAQRAGSAEHLLEYRWLDDGRTIEDLADFVAEVANSEEYDEEWEDRLGSNRPLREFFGWLHVDSQPIVDMRTIRGLEFFDVIDSADRLKRRSFAEQRERYAAFKNVYRAVVGHATEGTDHELPIDLEIYLLFVAIWTANKTARKRESNEDVTEFYTLVIEEEERRAEDETGDENATDDEGDLDQLVASYVEAFEGGGFEEGGEYGWETWKWDYLEHYRSTVAEGYDLRDLAADEIEPILEAINDPKIESNNVPTWLMAYGAGWHGFKTVAEEDPIGAAETLSVFFDDERNLVDRLETFAEFFGPRIDEHGSKGHVLGMASFLLMYTFPDRYVFYKWGEFRPFFERYFSYTVGQGFDPEQYVEILDHCEAVLERLESHFDDPSMIHVQNLIWFQQRHYGDSGVSEENDDAEIEYFWVSQSDRREIEGQYLDAPVDDIWSHDLSQLNAGDVVFHYHNQQIIGHSTVTQEATTIPVDGEDHHRVAVDYEPFEKPRPIEEVRDYLQRADVRREKYYPISESGSVISAYLCRLTEEAAEYLREASDDGAIQRLEVLREKLDPISVDFEMPAELYFEDGESLRSEIEASLDSGKHIIFTGPPGTGKTKLATEICRQCTDDLSQVDGHTFTTATSEWTAFDTIGGYVPSTDAGESADELTFQPRLFLNCFRREQQGIVNNWLVIDEINRSDIDKAFGQLFSVLSGDSVELPYERQNQVEIVSVGDDASEDELRAISSNPDAFPVSSSWRLLATMNTYDKASLYEMSYAFMRRFNFIHVGIPELVTDDDAVRASLLDPDGNDNYATAWLAEDPSLRPTLEAIYAELAIVWKVINSYPHSIGPSIVRDILGYADAYGVGDHPERSSEALTTAIVGMIYPQLEGLRPDKQRNLVRELAGTWETDRGTVTLDVDGERLEAKAADFFNVRFDDE